MITAHAFYKSASYLCVFQQSNHPFTGSPHHPAGLTPRRTLGMTSCSGWAAQSSDRKTVRTKRFKQINLISSKNHPKIIQNHPKSTLLLLFPQRGSQDVFFTSLHLPNSVRTIPRQAPHNKQVQACGRPPGKGGSVCNHSLILIEFNFNQNPDVHS